MKTPHRLSKSTYLAGLQCVKQLWWRVHQPEASELVPGVALQAVLDEGHEVTAKAREFFAGGRLIEAHTVEQRVEETRRALARGERVLFEAALEHDGVVVVADVLERVGSAWTLTEVKSSTRVKREHIPDLAIQAYVLRASGIDVARVELMHLNRQCRYPDLTDLFVREDVTADVLDTLPEVEQNLRTLLGVLEGPLPPIDPGKHCTRPRACPFMDRCCVAPGLDAIEHLYGSRGRVVEYLRARGCRSLDEIPVVVRLSDVQRRQREAAILGRTIVEDGLRERLARLDYPVAHLDFETVQPAIPVWDGCRPYDQVPAQFSVHIEDGRGGVRHVDWIASGPGDPRRDLALELIRVLNGARSVLVYSGFEESRIQELRQAVPESRAGLQAIVDRIVDLLPIVQEHVYDPAFAGSFSIKSVYPALVSEPGYADLDIADGMTASFALERLLFDERLGEGERSATREALRDYCRMDTLAMVQLLDRLRGLRP